MCRQNVGLGERDAVHGRYDDRGRKRREGQVGSAKALPAEVLAVREPLRDEVKLAPDRGFVLGLDALDGWRVRGAPIAPRAAIRGEALDPPTAGRPGC